VAKNGDNTTHRRFYHPMNLHVVDFFSPHLLAALAPGATNSGAEIRVPPAEVDAMQAEWATQDALAPMKSSHSRSM
jgi:hypothetical protein